MDLLLALFGGAALVLLLACCGWVADDRKNRRIYD